MICDDTVVPPDQAQHYAPRPFALSGCYQANDAVMPDPPRLDRASEGLPDDAVVLCCFNNFYKITPEIFAIWMAILRAAPRTLLWLTDDNPTGIASLRRHAAEAGVDPSRIVFASRCDPQHYMARLRLSDLFLDTFPYNAGTVASDALRMGVPIVTMAGRSFASRMASSLLTAVGASGGITTTLEAYRDKAITLATDTEARRAARALVSGQAWTKGLGVTAAFAARMEAGYRAMVLRP